MSTKAELYQIADELRGIASLGLRFSENGYDRERYAQVLKASARLVAALEGSPLEDTLAQYTANLDHVSPILCVEGVVFRQGKILLIQRRDDRTWAVPGGLAEIGESPARAVERELWEEAGLHGTAARLLGVYDSRLWPGRSRMQLCILQFLVLTGEDPRLHSGVEDGVSPFAETLAVDFFDEHALPGLHPGHELRVPMAFKLQRGEVQAPYFDHEAFTEG